MAFAAAFTEKAAFGMSMVVAPAYIIHLKVSEFIPWFTFGISEYCFQGFLILLTVIIMRRFKLSYVFSLATAVIYGTLLDISIYLISGLPDGTLIFRIIYFIIGTLFCSIAVSLFFHTYFSPEAYELIVKEISAKTKADINKVKTAYDCISTLFAIVLSFIFFGFGVFRGVNWGTVICALINGFLISRFTKLFEHFFEFKNLLRIEKYFT
jgi:uncharacterized membrane protein YczE